MLKINSFFTLIALIFSLGSLCAQSGENLPLSDVLQELEKQFDCSFSYNDASIENHVTTRIQEKNLVKALGTLSKNTLFKYTMIGEKNIAISLKNGVKEFCFTVEIGAQTSLKKDTVIITSFQQLATDAQGQVNILVPEQEGIIVTSPGFQRRIITAKDLNPSNCNTLFLTEDIEELNPVFLTQYITKGISKNTDGSVAIDFKDFIVLPGLIEKDILFTLQALPGIQSVNENVSYLNIRGGTNDQNLILWDGIKMYQNGHFFGLISAFNPSITNKATFTRNGTRAALGDGVSGTIELFTNHDITTKLSAEAGLNMLSTDAFIDVPLSKKASVQVAGRKSLNSVWSTPTYSAYFEKTFQNTEVSNNVSSDEISDPDFSFYDASVRLLLYPSEKDKIRVNLMAYQNDLTFTENGPPDFLQMETSLNSGLSQNTFATGVNYTRTWSDLFQTELQVYGTNYNIEATNADLSNNQTLLQENTIEESGITLEGKYKLLENTVLKTGYQFVETGITNLRQLDNPTFFQKEKEVLRRNSGFAAVSYISKNKKTQWEVGARANHYGKFNTLLLEPRIRFSQRLQKYFAIEVLGEFKSQNTSQLIDLQKDFLGIENRRWVLSSPESIPIIESKQFSIGFSYSRRGILINIEPYIKEVNGITAQSQGFQNQFENSKATGSYLVKGVDVLFNKKIDDAAFWLSYSYADNRYTFANLDPSVFHNNLDITNTLTAGFNYTWRQFDFSSGLNWHTGRPFTKPENANSIINGEIQYAFPNKERIKDYIRVDVSAIYNFKVSEKIKAMAGVSFWNVTARRNHIRTFFNVNDNQEIEQINDRALPFTPNATFRVFF